MSESSSLDRETEVEFLRGLVERYSPSGKEEPARDYLVRRLPELGYSVEVDDAGNVIARTGGRGPEVLLTSHMDTVRGQVPVRRDGDVLYGRGSVDAKGPLASMCLAGARVPDANVTVVGVVEEEVSGRGARHLVDSHPEPDYLVNGEPSGSDTVTLGYRGILRLRYRVTGDVIHTARPGVNAIEDVVDFWTDVSGLEDDGDGFDCLSTKPTELDSDSDGFRLDCEIRGGIRIPPERSVSGVREAVEEIADGRDGEVVFGESTEPVVVDRSNAVARAFVRSIRDVGMEPGLSVKTGTSDMNVYSEEWSCPMVTYGPGDSSLDHTPDEHIELKDYGRAIDVLERVVEDLGDD
ncbi:MAG: [LysW]-lysine hydrolase [Halobacteriales archaeon]